MCVYMSVYLLLTGDCAGQTILAFLDGVALA